MNGCRKRQDCFFSFTVGTSEGSFTVGTPEGSGDSWESNGRGDVVEQEF